MATTNTTIKFTGQFDTSQITKGLQDIKKQVTNANISDELKKQFEAAFNKLQVNIPALEKLTSKEDFNLKDIEALQKLLKEVTKDWENLNKVTDQIDLSKTFSAKDIEKINNLDKQIKQTQDNIQKARKELVDAFTNDTKISVANKNVSDALTELFTVKPTEIDSKFKEIQSQFAEGVQQTQTELKNKLENANIQKTGGSIIDYFFGKDSGVDFANKVGPVKEQINEIIRKYREFKQANDEVGMAEQIQKLNQVLTDTANFKFPEGYELFGLPTQEDLDTLNQIGDVLKKVKELAEGKEVFFTEEEAKRLDLLKQKIEAKTQATLNSKNADEQMHGSLSNINNVIEDTNDKANKLIQAWQKTNAQSEALDATFGSLAKRITNSISALTVFNKGIQILHKAIASVKELDAAFTQIAIVSEKTNKEAWQMFDSFNKLAKQYSITTKDLTEGAKLFYQQGLSAADTMKMVEASTISAALGEVSMAEAANTLTAAIQGYNESAEVAMSYTDKIAMVGAVSAADFNELSAAMEKTASSAYTAGLDFDNLLGYLGKMIEVTREAPANLGTAMKTIIARFEDMKKDPMAILEDGVSANKVETALKSIGVALRDATGEFRPLQEVFYDLGTRWDSLTRNQQAYIATVAAGSRQQSRFLAIFNNFDRTLELVRESQNSAGAAAQQYATYQDSVAAATARLTASWEKFYSELVSSDAITTTINSLTKLVEVMNKIGPAWTAAIATISAHGINKIIKGNLIGNIIDVFSQKIKNSAGEELVISVSSVFKDGIRLGIKEAFHHFDKSTFNEYSDALAKAGQIGATKGMQAVGSVGSALGQILPILGGITVAILAIVAVVKLVSYIIDENNKKIEKSLLEESKRNKELIKETNNLKEQTKTIDENLEIYEKYEKAIILTNEELEEQHNAVDAIKEQYDGLIVITDELGRKEILNTNELKEQNKILKNNIKQKENELALNKLNAVRPHTEQTKKKYGENNNTYMQDWTEEGLMNFGFSQQEAEILDAYGEMFRNSSKTQGSFFDYVGQVFNFGGKRVLKEDSLFNRIINDAAEADLDTAAFTGRKAEVIWEPIIEKLQTADEENLKEIINASKESLNLTEEGEIFLNILKKYAKIALDAKKILEKQTSDFIKSSLTFGVEDINDSKLQNDLFNLYNNLDVFNNNEYINKIIEEKGAENVDDIKDEIDRINKEISNYIETLSPSNKASFHELTEKLLDPSLSPIEKNDILSKFKEQAGGINGELNKILEGFVKGSTIDIERRKKLSESTKIDQVVLNTYNSRQLQLLDQMRLANKNENKNMFDNYFSSFAGASFLKSLSNLDQDVKDNPAIYSEAQRIIVDFFEDNFNLERVDAINLFQDMFGTIPDAALEAAKTNFDKAKGLLSMEPTQSLSDDQYTEAESILGENLHYYIEINEEGEKYLTLAGRIAALDEASVDLRESLNAKIAQTKLQIEEINESAEKTEDGTKKINEEQEKQIKNLERTIELDNERIQKLDKIRKYTAQVTAETSNINRAQQYHDNLDTIKKAEDEMKKFNGKINNDTAAALMAMDASYTKYLNKRLEGTEYYYTISQEGLTALRGAERINYNKWIADEKLRLDTRINDLEAEYKIFESIANGELTYTEQEFEAELIKSEGIIAQDEEQSNQEKANDNEVANNAIVVGTDAANQVGNAAVENANKAQTAWINAIKNVANALNQLPFVNINTEAMNPIYELPSISTSTALPDPQVITTNLLNSDDSNNQNNNNNNKNPMENTQEERARKEMERIRAEIDRLKAARDGLVPLGPELEEIGESGGKSADELKKLADVLEDLNDSIKELDDLQKEIKKNLKDITVDYNPFTDLFEAWEHEWDYYYNIKRLLQQIDTQGQYIDNIISADYISADKRIEAEHAKVGNLLAKMAANDTYIEALRAGMSQTAVELMKDYGEYYKVDPTTGQLYQTDKNLNDINELMNERKQEIYDLQKLQNEKENDLNLENAKLEALEKQKSAYEDILSTIESQYDSLKNNEDITADISGLEKEKTELEAKINITDDSIEAQKDKIRKMEDDIQDIEVGLTLKDQDFQKLEDYVSDMEDKVSEYEEYWENLNSTIAEQQELLSNLNELYKGYVDIAISTQQELYDAIVENYQNEINQKKKQYDYLKQLDNDYLQSVKDNVNKERQAREDANKQKSYQQNVQRAQLLQMDTSGAYRNELANLNKEIENQRQDLYDDLVDKQVEALEKEIDKRHELYDKEVAALEERLAYYQENAILLWEMVNSIVAEGANSMMATLENTTAYINSNELAKDQQRQTWEYNVQKTFDGVQNHTIDTLNNLIQAGNDFVINKYPEIGTALDDYKQVFVEASDVVNEYNSQLISSRDTLNNDTERATQVFQGILDSFMTTWNDRTNEFTGYAQNWIDVTNSLKQQTEDNLSELRSLYDDQGRAIESAIGSIEDYDWALRDASAEIYEDFLDERERYRDELESLVNQIQSEISAAIGDAAGEIRNAASNISVNSGNDNSGNGGATPSPTGSSGYDDVEESDHYKITGQYRYTDEYGKEKTDSITLNGYNSKEEAIDALYAYLKAMKLSYRWLSYNLEGYGISTYAKGGLASFTGPAWLDGTKSNPERVLSPKQTKLFESMVSSLERTANNSNINSPFNSSYNIGDINTTIQVEKLDNETDIEKVARQVENRIMKTIRNRVSISVA